METENIAFETPYLQVIHQSVSDRFGKSTDIHFTRTRPAVIAFVRTKDGQILLQDQYVYTKKARVLGCVAGYMDDGEGVEVAAQRELREESGYSAARIFSLGSAFAGKWADTIYHFVFMDGAEPSGEISLEPLEDIRTVLISAEKCAEYMEENPHIDMPTLVCLFRGLAFLQKERL